MKTIETVLSENQELSAHLLGVDGWILRTMPEDRRNVFLRLYEKALRTALHPDLIADKKKKKFYDGYLARVSEVVTSMCGDVATYETLAELVPSPKSKLIQVSKILGDRDQSVDDLRADIEQERKKGEKAKSEYSAALSAYDNRIKTQSRESAAYFEVFRQHMSLKEDANAYAIGRGFLKIQGRVITMRADDGKISEVDGEKIEIKKTHSAVRISGGAKTSIVGAFFVDGIRHLVSRGEDSAEIIIEGLKQFSVRSADDISLSINRYVVGFIRRGMILIIRHGEQNEFVKVASIEEVGRIGSLEKTIEELEKKVLILKAELKKK